MGPMSMMFDAVSMKNLDWKLSLKLFFIVLSSVWYDGCKHRQLSAMPLHVC